MARSLPVAKRLAEDRYHDAASASGLLCGYPFGGALSVVSAASPWRISRDRSASALSFGSDEQREGAEPEPGEHDDHDREGAPRCRRSRTCS